MFAWKTFRATAAVALLLSLVFGSRARAQHPPVLEGRVVDRVSGAGVPGAVVRASGRARDIVADAAGSFRIRGVPPGASRIEVRATGYLDGSAEVDVRNGQVARVRIVLDPAPLRVAGLTVGVAAVAAGATVLDRSSLDALGAGDLGAALQTVPGAIVTRRGGPGGPATVSIRGSAEDQVLVLLDGLPVNAPMTGGADLSSISLEGVERVTVLPGAQSSRYGPRALGGVILVEGRRSEASHTRGTVATGSWGSADVSVGAGGSTLYRDAEWGGRIGAEYRSTRGDFEYAVPVVRGGGTTSRLNADSRTLSASGAGDLALGSAELRIQGHALDLERGMPGPVTAPTLTARQRQRRLAGGATAAFVLGARWDLAVDGQSQTARFVDPATTAGPPIDDETVAHAIGGRIRAAQSLGSVDLEWGGEARHLGLRSTALAPDAPDRQRSFGVWSAATLGHAWGDGWSGTLGAALRVDRHTFLLGPEPSPRVNASISHHRWTLRGSAGSAFAPPSFGDQFFQQGVFVRPNPELGPERVRAEVTLGADVHLLASPAATLSATVDWYRADVDGMILWFPDHRFIWSPHNFDVVRQGWEASLDLNLARVGARASAAVARSAVEYAGSVLQGQVAYRPRWTAHGSLSAALSILSGELSTRYVGSRRSVPGSSANSLDAYIVSDVRAGIRWRLAGWRAETRLSVLNVLAADAALLPDYPLPGRSWGLELRLHPRP